MQRDPHNSSIVWSLVFAIFDNRKRRKGIKVLTAGAFTLRLASLLPFVVRSGFLAAGDGATGRTAGGSRGSDEAGTAWPTAARVRPDGGGDRADGRVLVLRHEVFRPQEACRALSAYVKYAA